MLNHSLANDAYSVPDELSSTTATSLVLVHIHPTAVAHQLQEWGEVEWYRILEIAMEYEILLPCKACL